jgi:hypothetical protein
MSGFSARIIYTVFCPLFAEDSRDKAGFAEDLRIEDGILRTVTPGAQPARKVDPASLIVGRETPRSGAAARIFGLS